MALLRISGSVDALPGPNEIEGLDSHLAPVERLVPDRYQISCHGPEALIPELEARGCVVQVLMSTEEIAQFLSEVAAAVGGPEGDGPPGPGA
jgi:hypothetical protein